MLTIIPAAADQAHAGQACRSRHRAGETFFNPPADAPADLAISGKFTNADRKRIDTVGSVMGASYISAPGVPRETGVKLPFKGQPMQGFSGLKSAGDGTFWVLQDNGFGTKANSPDAMLVLHRIKPDWASGKVEVLRTIFVHDPDKKIPFQITLEGTAEALPDRRRPRRRKLPDHRRRDLDRRRVRALSHPHRPGRQGQRVLRDQIDGKPARSPDHYLVSTPAVPGGAVPFTVRRSRGYEAMAASKDGRFLYPLLEGPLWDDSKKAWEMDGDREYLRILEFDVTAQKWTGRLWKYRLEINGNNIGDFNMIDATTGLIIERDNGEGELPEACTGAPRPDCFNIPAKMKRIYKIEMNDANAGGFVRKIAHLDLLAIKDPDKKAKQGTKEGIFTLPFVTIEGSTSSTIATSSSATTTTCRTRRAASSASRTTTS